MVDLYEKRTCWPCKGSGRVQTGEAGGSCDGPQYGDCSDCKGKGHNFVPVVLVIKDKE